MSHGMIIHNPKFHPNRANHCKTPEKAKIWQPWPPKIKFAICLPMARTITTQSFVQIGLTIAELQKNKYMATLTSKNQICHLPFYGMENHHPKFRTNWAHRCRVTALRNIWQPWTKNKGHCARSHDHRTYHAKFRPNPSRHFGMHSRTDTHTHTHTHTHTVKGFYR